MDMSVWYLMGAALVFFMQCGFAMVEAGFTRSKNVGNITMKNLMDFCIGTVAFYLLGYNLLCGDGGFIGWGLNHLLILGRQTGPDLYLTWYSVQRQQRSFPEQWQSVPNLLPIVFTVLLSVYVFTRSKLTGYGAEHRG